MNNMEQHCIAWALEQVANMKPNDNAEEKRILSVWTLFVDHSKDWIIYNAIREKNEESNIVR